MPRHLHQMAAAALLSAVASPSVSANPPSDGAPRAALQEVVAIERAFSDDSVKLGVKKSFLKYAADDGVIFRPGPVPAVTTVSKDPDDDHGATLQWWPVMGAISRSDDLALSVGPWSSTVPARLRTTFTVTMPLFGGGRQTAAGSLS